MRKVCRQANSLHNSWRRFVLRRRIAEWSSGKLDSLISWRSQVRILFLQPPFRHPFFIFIQEKGSHFVGAFSLGANYERIRQVILQLKEMESLPQFIHTSPNNDWRRTMRRMSWTPGIYCSSQANIDTGKHKRPWHITEPWYAGICLQRMPRQVRWSLCQMCKT